MYLMDFIAEMVRRYGFQKYPATAEDYNSPNGAVFTLGRMGDIVIENYIVYRQGVVVDTRSSTRDSEAVLDDVSKWICEISGADPSLQKVVRKFCLSQVTFQSNGSLDALNPQLVELGRLLSERVSEQAKLNLVFQATALHLQFDFLGGIPWTLPFRIERQEGIPFSENRYFSQAPLSTEEHLMVLEKFETALLGSQS
jgi:hypothetical protein